MLKSAHGNTWVEFFRVKNLLAANAPIYLINKSIYIYITLIFNYYLQIFILFTLNYLYIYHPTHKILCNVGIYIYSIDYELYSSYIHDCLFLIKLNRFTFIGTLVIYIYSNLYAFTKYNFTSPYPNFPLTNN